MSEQSTRDLTFEEAASLKAGADHYRAYKTYASIFALSPSPSPNVGRGGGVGGWGEGDATKQDLA